MQCHRIAHPRTSLLCQILGRLMSVDLDWHDSCSFIILYGRVLHGIVLFLLLLTSY